MAELVPKTSCKNGGYCSTMNEAMENERVIVLVDMDCFYVQVELRELPDFIGKPVAVAQYSPGRLGGLLAVSYEAREFGVERGMRPDQARKICPELHVAYVPNERGKANIDKYRKAGAEVLKVLGNYCDTVERASVDEAYLDLSSSCTVENGEEIGTYSFPNTHVVGYENDDAGKEALMSWYSNDAAAQRFSVAAKTVLKIREAILAETGFKASAGIANNKMLAKLACGMNKPNQQTVLPFTSVPLLFQTIPINKIRNLGGKCGQEVRDVLRITTMGELAAVPLQTLRIHFPDRAEMLLRMANGIDSETVTDRRLSKSLGCGKNFPGRDALSSVEKIQGWVKVLCEELVERLLYDQQENKRSAKLLTICYNQQEKRFSKSCQLGRYDVEKFSMACFNLIMSGNSSTHPSNVFSPPITSLAMSASKFENECISARIDSFFQKISDQESPETKSHHCRAGTSGGAEGHTAQLEGASRKSQKQILKYVPGYDNAELDTQVLSQLPVEIQQEVISAVSPNASPSMKSYLKTFSPQTVHCSTVTQAGNLGKNICSKPGCGEMIEPGLELQHEDFHLAKKISEKDQKLFGDMTNFKRSLTSSTKNTKRTKTLNDYFT